MSALLERKERADYRAQAYRRRRTISTRISTPGAYQSPRLHDGAALIHDVRSGGRLTVTLVDVSRVGKEGLRYPARRVPRHST